MNDRCLINSCHMSNKLRMLPSEVEKLDIRRIFPSARENWKILYVELGSDHEVDTIFRHTRNMVNKDHRVIPWVPRQMYDRFRAVESIAYAFRRNQNHKTRVKVGRDDLELCTREPGSSIWKKQELPENLPKFEIAEIRHALASSPPPGRPGRGQMFGGRGSEEVEAEVVLEENVAREEAAANI